MKMTIIRCSLSGTHPFSEELIQAILDFKYGRIDKESVKKKFQSELSTFILFQEDLKVNPISTGSFGIEDIIRPFTRSLSSFISYEKLGDLPINRWHYTNTFYRKPQLIKKFPSQPEVLNFDVHSLTNNNSFSHHLLEDKNAKIILPGPYSLTKLIDKSELIYSNEEETIIAAGEYLAIEIESLPPQYIEIQLDEPYFVWHRIPRDLRSGINIAYENIKTKSPNRKVVVNTYFGDASNIYSFLLDLPISGFGIDFFATNPLDIAEYSLEGKILQAGIINAQNWIPKRETKQYNIQLAFVEKVLHSFLELEPAELVVTSQTGLDYLPREIADEKLVQMSYYVKSMEGN